MNDEERNHHEIMNAFLRLMKLAMFDAEKAYKCVFGDKNKYLDQPNPTALSYVATMMAKCCAAQSIFYSNLHILDHSELRSLFAQFNNFAQELQNNFAEDHSHQWSGIEFDRLEQEFNNSVCAQSIQE